MNRSEIVHIQETTSTFSYIRDREKNQTIHEGFTVYADYQSAGRGQRGNSWESARGENLLFSTLLYPKDMKANGQFILSQIISLAISDVLAKETSGITIKWPNDIYWNEKKIAGILIENDIMDNLLYRSILGAGVNINQTLFASDAPNPVSLKLITGKTYSVENILGDTIDRLKYYYDRLSDDGYIHKVRVEYKQRLFRKEGKYLFEDSKSRFRASIEDVEESGLLVLKTEEGNVRKYAFKEIRYVR